MINKPTLSFYTNIPAPYQLSFFNALSRYFTLTVIYYSTEQNGNIWNVDASAQYKTILLNNTGIVRLIQRYSPDFHFSWKIFRTVFHEKSEHVIVSGAYWIPNAAVALIINKIRRKKVYYFSEALFEVKSKAKYLFKKAVLQILNVSCTGILCTGKKAALSFEKFKVKPVKYIVPYNIDIETFKNIDQKRLTHYLNQYKINNEFIILTSGFLIHRKGIDILIKALNDISSPYKLIILGDGDQMDALKILSSNNEQIIFAGFQKAPEIPYFFSIADLFVFPSRYDGWGVVINEAIAANVPVISSNNVGAATELLTNGVDGLICESENVSAFREAIESMISDPVKRNIIKVNALSLIPRISSDYNARYVLEILSK